MSDITLIDQEPECSFVVTLFSFLPAIKLFHFRSLNDPLNNFSLELILTENPRVAQLVKKLTIMEPERSLLFLYCVLLI